MRPARLGEAHELAAIFARAYEDDAVSRWVLPDPTDRLERLERAGTSVIRRTIPEREVLTTTPPRGMAIWAAPEHPRIPTRRLLPTLPALLRWYGLSAMRRSALVAAVLDRRRPTERHWYLGGLGTDPPFQRQGVATALMRPMLERCDAGGVGAYLETQSEENVAFYRRRGFEVAAELDIPTGGPHMWLMWREPRRPAS